MALAHIWVSTAVLMITVGLLFLYRNLLPPEVPLWYSRPWGQDQLAHPRWLWLVLGLIGIVVVASGWVGKKLAPDKLLVSLWIASLTVVEVMLALAVVRIVWLMVF